MTNLDQAPSVFLDDERRASPRHIINADVYDGGVLVPRGGYRKLVSLINTRSLWAGSVMLCVADGSAGGASLYRINADTSQELCSVEDPDGFLNYLEVNGKVYISGRAWTGVYDILANSMHSWGVPLPDAPQVSISSGNLPGGKYSLCYTRFEGERQGGTGHIVDVSLEGDGHGIELLNFADDYIAWITHANGGDFFLAQLDGGVIRNQTPFIQPLTTLGVFPAPRFTHSTAYAFGRVWGTLGKKLVFSEPFQPEFFRVGGYKQFIEDLVMVASVASGLFVNSQDSTWFLGGTSADKMSLTRLGEGAIPGTLTMGLVEGGGYEVSKQLAQMPMPIWFDRNGMVIGTHNGHLVHWTKSKLKVTQYPRGAAFNRMVNGVPQVVVTLYGNCRKHIDPEMQTIIQDGQLF